METHTVTERTRRAEVNALRVMWLMGRMESWIAPIKRKTRNAQAR